MKAVIFDTETNGKILDWNQKLRNDESISNFPRITQIAWQMVDLNTSEILNEHQSIIKPAGWTVPKEKFFIENNISTERCAKEGNNLRDVLPLFIKDLEQSEIVVAHNMNFDMNVIGAEFIRLNFTVGKKLIKICTMEKSTDFCKIESPYGGYKFPKLVELYKILFDKDMQGNHDAFDDVVGCRECFLQLIKLNQIVI